MSKKSQFDGVVVARETTTRGILYSVDKHGRICWDNTEPERVILVDDLRRYGEGLHKGQTGWTVPGTSDGYKRVEVQFDNGVRIPVQTFRLERVVPEKAQALAKEIVDEFRGTRFDADPKIACAKRKEWLQQTHGQFIDFGHVNELGDGPHEVYAYTYQSLIELADYKGLDKYPVKIGHTAEIDMGTYDRILTQIGERAAWPERIKLLIIFRCDQGRVIELKLHRSLRAAQRKVQASIGREWYYSNHGELTEAFEIITKHGHDCTLSFPDETV
jgi:hypothetical protein